MTIAQRFTATLAHECRIQRQAATMDADLDLQLGTVALVSGEGARACLFVPLRVGDEMLAVGPLERDVRRLYLPLGTDVQEHDQVTNLGDDSLWVVTGPPMTQDLRGEAHHLEALVERVAVQ